MVWAMRRLPVTPVDSTVESRAKPEAAAGEETGEWNEESLIQLPTNLAEKRELLEAAKPGMF